MVGGEFLVLVTWLYPEIMVLNRGWFCFIFRSPEDAEKILGGFWLCRNGSLMVKIWYIGFNPDKDFFQKRHIWVLLP
jgi:hypothetical protein